VLQQYLAAPFGLSGRTLVEEQAERDRKRVAVIETELAPVLTSYLSGAIELAEFKRKVDGISKQHPYWGFRGAKGQMFFNLVVKTAGGQKEGDLQLKSALVVPSDEKIASSRIDAFASYVKLIGQHHIEIGGDAVVRSLAACHFSYPTSGRFKKGIFGPVYHTNNVNTMVDLNLWQPAEDLSDNYLTYKHIHEELARLFSSEAGRPFSLYDVEHVFWFKGGSP
jgi:hypothetical protein